MSTTLTSSGLQSIAQQFMDSVDHASFKDDGIVVDDVTIYRKERTGTTVRIYVAIGLTYSGTISEIKLYDDEDNVLAQSSEIIAKPDNKGIYVTFKYEFTEEEVAASE